MTDESEIRLPFYRSFTTFWIAFSGLCTQVFYSWAQVRGDVKSSCVRKLKVTQPLVAYPEAFRHLPVYRWAPKLGA